MGTKRNWGVGLGPRPASLCWLGRQWALGNLWVSDTQAGLLLRGWVGVGVGDTGQDPWAASGFQGRGWECLGTPG